MTKKNTLYVATKLDDDLWGIFTDDKDLILGLGGNVSEPTKIEYENKEQAIEKILDDRLKYIMPSTIEFMYDSMVNNDGFYIDCI